MVFRLRIFKCYINNNIATFNIGLQQNSGLYCIFVFIKYPEERNRYGIKYLYIILYIKEPFFLMTGLLSSAYTLGKNNWISDERKRTPQLRFSHMAPYGTTCLQFFTIQTANIFVHLFSVCVTLVFCSLCKEKLHRF